MSDRNSWVEQAERERAAIRDIRRCAMRGCSNTFLIDADARRGSKKYCSIFCRKKDGRIRRGEQFPISESWGGWGNPRYMCRNGLHEAGPETTYVFHLKDGSTRHTCRPCKMARQRAYDRRKRAEREAAV